MESLDFGVVFQGSKHTHNCESEEFLKFEDPIQQLQLHRTIDRRGTKAGLNGDFIENFMILNTINFVDDMTKREKNEVSWDARKVSSP